MCLSIFDRSWRFEVDIASKIIDNVVVLSQDYFFRFSLSPRPSSGTILALNQFSMINAIQGKLNSTRQCNAILGRGNFCFFSFCFQLLSCRHCVESRGESALVTDRQPLAHRHHRQQGFRNNKRHNYPLLLGSASVKVGDKDDVSDC